MDPTFDELKNKGNEKFKNGHYEEALACFEQALKLEPKATVIHSNMAAALLPLRRYSEAYDHASKAVIDDKFKEKSLYRLVKASCGMQNLKQASEHVEEIATEFLDNVEEVINLLNNKAKNDVNKPKPDLTRIWDEIYLTENRNVAFTDYYGPIKIVKILGKGRGIIVTKDVKAGTLLFAEKPYAIGVGPCAGDMDSSHPLIVNILKKTREHPETIKYLVSLHSGTKTTDFDSLVLNITQKNVKGIHEFLHPRGFKANIEDRGCLCIMFSFLNHSCIPNTWQVFFGDILAVFAIKDLKAGDELTTNYVGPELFYDERNPLFQLYWRFECDCPMCDLDRKEGQEKRNLRRGTLEGLYELVSRLSMSQPQENMASIKSLISQLKETYQDRKFPIHLALFLMDLWKALVTNKNAKRDVEFYKEILNLSLEFFKICEPDMRHILSPKHYLDVSDIYRALKEPNMAREWTNRAYEYHKMLHGIEGMERFLKIFA